MNCKNLFFLILTLVPIFAFGQTSKVYDDLRMTSQLLKMERKYAIYLPPNYESSKRSYPVLYLLHGAGDDQTGWVQFGEVQHLADKAIREGKATPMIIIMPDADTKVRGYFNSPDNEWQYEDFFFDEFMPYVEKKFRVKSEKRYRAIAGLSMGGGGSFQYALHRPDLFSSACPLSASTGPLTLDAAKNWVNRVNKNETTYSETELQNWFKKYSTVEFLKNMDAKMAQKVRWFIDCGDDDFLYEGNSLVHIAMRKMEIKHEFRIRNGGHNWTYWRESLPVVLSFVSDAFHQY